jgi:hypothetical protein
MLERPTGDIVVQDVILLDDIVNDLFGVFVDNQTFPLLRQGRQSVAAL